MLNKLGLEIEQKKSCYQELAQQLNGYYANDCNSNMGSLRTIYFRDIWRGTTTFIGTESCDLQLFCVGFNSVPNLIVILFNFLYPVFHVRFHCKGCVWEKVWRLKANWRSNKFSQVTYEKPSYKVKHMLSTWLECEESWQMVLAGFCECLTGKTFPRDTCETFYFANFSYLIHQISNHTIYTHITHIC